MSDSSLPKSIQLKASAWGICTPGVYFSLKSKPIRPFAHHVILADAVFGAKRYLSGLGSFCRVNRLP